VYELKIEMMNLFLKQIWVWRCDGALILALFGVILSLIWLPANPIADAQSNGCPTIPPEILQQIPPELLQQYLEAVQAGCNAASSSAFTLSAAPNPGETDSIVIATAQLPNNGNPSSAQFTWFVQNQKRSDLSGIGKNVAGIVTPSTPGSLLVRVDAIGPANATSSAHISIPIILSSQTKAFQGLQNQIDDLIQQKNAVESQFDVVIQISPDAPKPSEIVILAVTGLQQDVSGADIIWFFNNKKIVGGTGAKTASAQVGPAGSTNTVRVLVTLPDGRTAEQSLSITPAGIDFYWWTNAYVPAWYRGKALPTPGSTIFIQARPSFSASISNALIYTWLLDGEIVQSASGQGKSLFAYGIPKTELLASSISVRVTNLSKTIDQTADFSIPVVSPDPQIYELRPLEGIRTAQPIQTVTRQAGKAIDLVIEPFFIPRAIFTTARYQWALNGKNLPFAATKPWVFGMTSEPDSSGDQDISVTLDNPSDSQFQLSKSMRITLQ